MTILATQTFDALAEEQVATTGLLGSPWIVFATGTAYAASAAHGDRGLLIDNVACRVAFEEASATTATRVLSHYFRLETLPSTNAYMASLYDADASATRADWRVSSTGAVTLRDAQVATGGTSTEVLQTGVFYRAEWRIASDGQELRIFEGESIVPYITRVGALTSNAHTSIGCGISSSPSGAVVSIDSVVVGDDWVGPFGTPEVPLDTPQNFTLTSHPSQVQLTADAEPVEGAASYEVELERLEGEAWTPVDVFTTTTLPLVLDDTDGLAQGTTYRGRIRALPAGD